MNRIQQLNNQINSTNGEDDIFSHITQAPADPIFGISMAYKADKSDLKIDLGVGAYRTDEEKPYIFEIVKKVEREIVNDTSLNKEYLPIDGIADYCKLTQQLVFGKTNPILAQGKVISAQALGGTGALRMGFDFIKKHIPADVYVSKPTWSNHLQVVERAGLNVLEYPYFDPKTNGFNLKGMLDTLSQARMGSVVLLHVCAHNPTGVDPTQEEWLKIADVCRRRRLVPFFDSAYQGFASGDLQQDAYSVRKFAELGFQMLVAQSFSKNMGLYNERVGALHIVASTKDIASKVQSQLKIVIRTAYSNPSAHGGRIATRILGNEANYQAWVDELKVVTGRIIKMRTLLKQELDQLKVPGNWSHITTQTGFFTFTGLTVQQCEKITSKHHVYMLKNGRMSMAGITTKNVKALAKAIQDVVVQ